MCDTRLSLQVILKPPACSAPSPAHPAFPTFPPTRCLLPHQGQSVFMPEDISSNGGWKALSSVEDPGNGSGWDLWEVLPLLPEAHVVYPCGDGIG